MSRGWLIRLPVNANGVGRVVRPVPPPVRHFSSTHPGLFTAGGGGGNDSDETVPPASGKRKGARASKRAAPVQAQPSDVLAADAKERERENKALREESKALLAKNDALLAENKALLAKNEALDEKLGEAERTKDASLADRLRRTMEGNNKAIEDNRKAIEGNNKAIEDNRKAIEGLLLVSGGQVRGVSRNTVLYGLVKDCVLQPIPWKGEGQDPRLCVATLPEGQSWLTLESSVLFVRRCYSDLWDKLDLLYKASQAPGSDKMRRVLLLGTPGIGKTVSMNYFLNRALNVGYKVLFETREERFYFHDGVVESELLEGRVLSNIHGDPAVFFLVDHQQDQPPPFVKAFTVAAMSPNQRNFKEFVKNRCKVYFVPLPTTCEVVAMNSVWPRLSATDLQARLERYGPIPRRLFGEQSWMQLDLSGKINSSGFKDVLTQLLTHGNFLPTEFEGLSWTVLHLTTEDYETVSRVTWASQSVMQQALAVYDRQKFGELEQIIAKGLGNPARLHNVDGEFQYWACHVLAAGGQWPLHTAKYKENSCCYIPSSHLQLPKGEVRLVNRLPSASSIAEQPGVLHYSKLANEPLCDAALVEGTTLFLFQMTIGATHNFNLPRWDKLCSEAKHAGLTCVQFIYVVPRLKHFTVPQDQMQLFEGASTQELQKTLVVLVIEPKKI